METDDSKPVDLDWFLRFMPEAKVYCGPDGYIVVPHGASELQIFVKRGSLISQVREQCKCYLSDKG